MDPEFIRFPHTPHLAWLAQGRPRSDKVLDNAEVAELLSQEVVVEEKVDGANVGLSVDARGRVRAQNRGQYLAPGGHPQFGPLWPWMDARSSELCDQLGPDRIVFGEWCFAVHSLRYDQLPDWFLGFDVFDRKTGEWWSTQRRDELFERVAIVPVPELLRGPTKLAELVALLERSPSRVGAPQLEGLYVRREVNDRLLARAKLVRAEFVQQIDEHWSRQPLRKNQLRQPG
jgi:hypothetical protein